MVRFYAVYKQIIDSYTGFVIDERCVLVADTKKEIASYFSVSERILLGKDYVNVSGKKYNIYEYLIDKEDIYDV